MLSEVTISFSGHTYTVPGLYLLAGGLIVLLIFGWIVVSATAGQIKHKQNDATEVFAIQLERIGDALDRLVAQNSQIALNTYRATQESPQRPETAPPPRAAANEPAESFSPALVSEMFPSEKEQPVESGKAGSSRTIPFSIFNR
jgi:hypothetical protein